MAQALLGKYLVHGPCVGQIIETEAYHQQGDESCHAYRGMTKRNATMFQRGGYLYVYRIHQVHCLNVVTETAGIGSAVLIRAIRPVAGIALMHQRRPPGTSFKQLANGPGKLCQALGIDRAMDGCDLTGSDPLIWIGEDGSDFSALIQASPRIGIRKATDLLWRFVVPWEYLPYLQ